MLSGREWCMSPGVAHKWCQCCLLSCARSVCASQAGLTGLAGAPSVSLFNSHSQTGGDIVNAETGKHAF